MAITAAELQAIVTAKTSDAERNLKSFSGKLDSAGQKARAVGGKMTAGLTLPLAGVGTAAFMASDKLNRGLGEVQSLGLAQDRVEEMKTSVQDMAVEVGTSTSDLTGGLYQVVSAFGDSADTAKTLEINAKAAKAGLAETTDAINLTSAVTKAYGDTSAEAVQHASDLAFQTVKMGQTTFPELAASIGRVTPLASELGVAQEELFGTLATATGVTGSAAEVNTQLRGVLQSLMAPTSDMKSLFAEMGVESGEALIQQRGLRGAVNSIVTASKKTKTPLKDYIGSIEGQTLALTLAGGQAETYAKKIDAMKEAAGATDKAFAAQTEGIGKAGFKMDQFRAKLEVTAQKLGDRLAPVLIDVLDAATPLLDKVAGWIEKFDELDPRTQKIILGVTALAAAIGPLLIVVGTMASGLSAVIGLAGTLAGAAGAVGSLASVGAALVAVINPITLVIGTVAGLFLAWKNNWFGIRDKTAAAVDAIGSAIDSGIGWLTSLDDRAAEAFANIRDAAATKITEAKDVIIGGLKEAWDYITGVPARAIGWGSDIIGALVEGLGSVEIPIPTFDIVWNEGPFGTSVPGLDIGANRKALRDLVPFLAEGGIVTRPTLAMMGEAGPEAVIPLDRGGVAGAGMNVTIVVQGSLVHEREVADLVHEKLLELQRRNVTLGFT